MPILDNAAIKRIVSTYVDTAGDNVLRPEIALRPDLVGLRLFGEPLVGVAAADDPCFEEMLRPGVIGSHFVTPLKWLPGARSVVSYFLPFTDAVIVSNRKDALFPSDEWLHGRIEGQGMVDSLGRHLAEKIVEAGHQAIYPCASEKFWSWAKPAGVNSLGMTVPGHTSNWSERHIAYACGLGTFSLSMALITEKGTAGRFGSVVTTLPLRPDARPYDRYDEYCTYCGACARNCFVGAISPGTGKDKGVCEVLLDERKIRYKPRYGCGKCYVNVPCKRGIPGRKPNALLRRIVQGGG